MTSDKVASGVVVVDMLRVRDIFGGANAFLAVLLP